MFVPDEELGAHALGLCQALIRIDTSNPPGNERPAAELLAGELARAGLEPAVLESAPGRANVVARLGGNGAAPPLLLSAHLDVVGADPAGWTHPPFAGTVADGFLWGRGAIDVKNMAAMSVALLCRLAREKVRLRRDLIVALVADEESGCGLGSSWLCAEHPERVRAEYALGEGGGFSLHLGARRYVTIGVAEKGYCWVRARWRGEPGHGSMPRADSAPLALCAAVARLGSRRLPAHLTPVVRDFLDTIVARELPALRPLVAALARAGALPRLLALLPDPSVGRALGAMLANTATPTVLRAGASPNVIPALGEAEIDGRTLPGQDDTSFLRELGAVLGPGVELEVMRSAPPVECRPVGSPLYDAIVRVLARHEPAATALPYLVPGFTDAKAFSRLGTRWYGFCPLRLPRELRFAELYHGLDERIPLEGLAWGTRVLGELVTGFAAEAAS
jgi:acetylornithine deacetylase/succinyl-diaminopimelate desuccinylase-like protein